MIDHSQVRGYRVPGSEKGGLKCLYAQGLSEVDKTSISRRGSQTRQRCPLSWLPVSRFLPPRSGLERSDFVHTSCNALNCYCFCGIGVVPVGPMPVIWTITSPSFAAHP